MVARPFNFLKERKRRKKEKERKRKKERETNERKKERLKCFFFLLFFQSPIRIAFLLSLSSFFAFAFESLGVLRKREKLLVCVILLSLLLFLARKRFIQLETGFFFPSFFLSFFLHFFLSFFLSFSFLFFPSSSLSHR